VAAKAADADTGRGCRLSSSMGTVISQIIIAGRSVMPGLRPRPRLNRLPAILAAAFISALPLTMAWAADLPVKAAAPSVYNWGR